VYVTGSFSGSATFGTFNLTASTPEDMFIARYDSSGSCIGVRHAGQGIGYSAITNGNGSCILTGNFSNSMTLGSTTLTSHGYEDIFIAKIDAIIGVGELFRMTNNQLIIYANPNEGKCTVKIPDEFLHEQNLVLTIYDNSGKLIQQKTLTLNEDKIKLSLEEQARGMYNVTLSNGKKSYNGKIIFE
jgi:hypothetical protein